MNDNELVPAQIEIVPQATSYDTEIRFIRNNNNSFLINTEETSTNNNNIHTRNCINSNSENENDVCINQQVHKNNRKRNKKYSGYVSEKLCRGAKSGRSIFSLNRRQSGGSVWQTTLNTAAAMTGVGQAQTMASNEINDNLLTMNADGDGDPSTNNKLFPDNGGGGFGGNGAPASTAATAIATAPPAGPKRPVRRGGKAQPDRPARVLFCLGLKNPLRKLCIDIVEWKYPFCQQVFSFLLRYISITKIEKKEKIRFLN